MVVALREIELALEAVCCYQCLCEKLVPLYSFFCGFIREYYQS